MPIASFVKKERVHKTICEMIINSKAFVGGMYSQVLVYILTGSLSNLLLKRAAQGLSLERFVVWQIAACARWIPGTSETL